VPAWQTTWSGWLEPANRNIIFGRWMAWRDPYEGMLVATTLGGDAGDSGPLAAATPGWPVLTSKSTDGEREAVRQRARALLQTQMEAVDASAI
jgi:hypothetical protein